MKKCAVNVRLLHASGTVYGVDEFYLLWWEVFGSVDLGRLLLRASLVARAMRETFS